MSEKPSYLGLLNAIAVGETEAEEYLLCWAATTSHPGVREVLTTVALREGEHGKSFAKRINELGYSVIWRDRGDEKRNIAADQTLTDLQKFECFGLGGEESDADDIFGSMFRDKNIDVQTATLLGRYIGEERDSGRLLRSCYEQLVCEAAAPAKPAAGSVESRLASIEATLTEICSRLGATV